MSSSAGRVLQIFKGDYSGSVQYVPLDCVLYQGSTYVCKATTQGNAPTNTTYWQIQAQGVSNAAGLSYNNTASHLTAANVQDAIDELNNDLTNVSTRVALNHFDDGIEINAFTNTNQPYVVPNDGYLYLSVHASINNTLEVDICDNRTPFVSLTRICASYQSQTNGGDNMLFLKKGMKLVMYRIGGDSPHAYFVPLIAQ